MKRALAALLFALGLSAIATPAHALACVALLGCSCSVHATPMSFGNNISPLSGAAATAESDVTVSCTNVIDALPLVSVQVGAGSNGTTGDRIMKSTTTADTLHYNLYETGSYGTILGTGGGTGYPMLVISGGIVSLGGWTRTNTIHGRALIPATTRPQTFNDTVTIRIDW